MVSGGDILGLVQETEAVEHRVMVPPYVEGKLIWLYEGKANIEAPIAKRETKDGVREIAMLQKWPVRRGRPYKKKLPPSEPVSYTHLAAYARRNEERFQAADEGIAGHSRGAYIP